MGTVLRQVVVTPPRGAARLLYDFATQDLLLSTLFTPPGTAAPPLNFEAQMRPAPRFNPALYEVQQNYALNTPSSLRIVRRNVVTNPIPRRLSLAFDFIPQNTILNLTFTPPGNPVFPRDLSSPVQAARRNWGLYDINQNTPFASR